METPRLPNTVLAAGLLQNQVKKKVPGITQYENLCEKDGVSLPPEPLLSGFGSIVRMTKANH